MKSLADIAAQLEGYDPQALSAEAVGRFLHELVSPVTEVQTLAIFDAFARVLAHDVISPVSVPPHDNSAMDGYAFDGSQMLAGHNLNLHVIGTAMAGKAWRGEVTDGQCVRIMTGAIMPEGLDTVAPQELCRVEGDRISIASNMLRPGDNRRLMGEDLMLGSAALQQGQVLTPAALGLLASLGLPKVTVRRRLKVAYFSTGDEILSLGETPREGAVYDSNRYTVFGLLTRLGCDILDMGVVPDQPDHLEAAFVQAAETADAIITSGGVSVGEADYTKAMMKKLGDVAFWRIAMRPGRPMAVGRINRDKLPSQGKGSAILFGLPGNPVAVMVTFLAFVRPALLRMMGCQSQSTPLLQARSQEALRKKTGRRREGSV